MKKAHEKNTKAKANLKMKSADHEQQHLMCLIWMEQNNEEKNAYVLEYIMWNSWLMQRHALNPLYTQMLIIIIISEISSNVNAIFDCLSKHILFVLFSYYYVYCFHTFFECNQIIKY